MLFTSFYLLTHTHVSWSGASDCFCLDYFIIQYYFFIRSNTLALGWLRRSQTQHWVMYCVLIFLLKLSSVPFLNPVQRRVHAADIYPNVSAIGHRRYRCARPRRMPPKACRLHTPYSKCVQDITASVVAFFRLLFFFADQREELVRSNENVKRRVRLWDTLTERIMMA